MLPLFKPGQIVLIDDNLRGPSSRSAARRQEPPRALQPSAFSLSPGDCIVYIFKGRSLLHRVIAVETTGVVVSDDAGALSPHSVPWSAVTGRVLTSNPLKKGLPGLLYHKIKGVKGLWDYRS